MKSGLFRHVDDLFAEPYGIVATKTSPMPQREYYKMSSELCECTCIWYRVLLFGIWYFSSIVPTREEKEDDEEKEEEDEKEVEEVEDDEGETEVDEEETEIEEEEDDEQETEVEKDEKGEEEGEEEDEKEGDRSLEIIFANIPSSSRHGKKKHSLFFPPYVIFLYQRVLSMSTESVGRAKQFEDVEMREEAASSTNFRKYTSKKDYSIF